VDKDANVYELADKGPTKAMAVEHLAGPEKTEVEVLLEASLKEEKNPEPKGSSKLVRGNTRKNYRQTQHALQVVSEASESANPVSPHRVETSGRAIHGEAAENHETLNIRQKFAEVRRRIGYIQKRGRNDRFNYSYVTAADIAGAIGDLLAELGVVVIPRLEDISYESASGRDEANRMARVVMAYTFADVDSGEQIVAKVAGQGLDPGDKAPYKAMTGALKYALLQSFLLASGDDPEDERGDSRNVFGSRHLITRKQERELRGLIEETGTDLERVLSYYKLASLEEMTEAIYRRAVELLKRKLVKQNSGESAHAPN
jgi:hypothetical protein